MTISDLTEFGDILAEMESHGLPGKVARTIAARLLEIGAETAILRVETPGKVAEVLTLREKCKSHAGCK